MKINQIILSEMATTAGSVATVAKPIGETQKRTTVRGLEPAEKVMSGKAKKKGPYANSLSEGKVKQLAMDLKGGRDGLTDEEFKKKYGKTKAEVRREMQNKPQKPEPVQEARLEEDDVIVVPGQGKKLKSGFVPHGKSRIDHEVEMAKSDLLQLLKNTESVMMCIKDRTEDDGLEGWVQEKIIKAADYMNTLAEYFEGKKMQEMTAGTLAGGIAAEAYDKATGRFFRPDSQELRKQRASNKPVNPNELVVPLSDVPVKKPRGHKEYDPAREFPGVKVLQREGAKVDRMVKHITKSEKKLGHSKKEAENIAWATANKRGMLDNKNKKKGK